jgi:organic hydroperoxide reductase OsmC/OhrA
MSSYSAVITWERGDTAFTDKRYSRGHRWTFDGGVEVPGSSSPHVVPLPYSVAEAVDPEEAFVASLSSCHMLWFLSLAADRGLVVDRYRDDAFGEMGKNSDDRVAMLKVTLRPAVKFAGSPPDAATVRTLHEEAHNHCFIASSVKTNVVCEPIY